ncbi:WD40 repeat domain-containing protein [Streptomyces sp. NPDC049099]|uniref:WD40 repeat domain-containing protein n=1 Tax=Streptomyces sp. NPDC049099 TaxID=3155768 RepID=UPI00341D19EF
MAFGPDGRVAATGSDDDTVRLWDAATARTGPSSPGGKPIRPLSAPRAVCASAPPLPGPSSRRAGRRHPPWPCRPVWWCPRRRTHCAARLSAGCGSWGVCG